MDLFEEKAMAVIVEGKELHCLICEGELFWQRKARIETLPAELLHTPFGRIHVTCVICAFCGYVHWFAPLKKANQ